MDTAKAAFIKEGFTAFIQANTNATNQWGKMNLQQMVEHVTDFFYVSTGKIQLPVVTPEEYLPKAKAFLLSDKEFRENTKAPAGILSEEPAPVRNESLEIAVLKLQKSIDRFFEYFTASPDAITTHPVFGALNFDEWVLLNYKHMRHHAKQFGFNEEVH